MPKFPYRVGDKTVTVFINGVPYSTARDNPSWNHLKELLDDASATAEQVIELFTPKKAMEVATKVEVGKHKAVSVRDGKIYFGDDEVNTALSRRMIDIVSEGLSIDPWVKFMEKVYANPWPQAGEELYQWIEGSDMPIVENGNFWAYKMVRRDYTDNYSGKMNNSIGQTVEMDRSKVDANRRNECSTGLHFCSLKYVTGGGRLMIVEIDPSDVVSIPMDYNFTKGRCCKFKVVGEIPPEMRNTIKWAPVGAEAPVMSPPEPPEVFIDDPSHHILPPKPAKAVKKASRKAPVRVAQAVTKAVKKVAAKKAAPKGRKRSYPVVFTEDHGEITKSRLAKLQKQHGTWKAVAAELKVSEGTLRGWLKRLKSN